MDLARRGLALLVAMVATTGCIGATDRADFEAEVRARGGGVSTTWIADGIDLVARQVGADDLTQLSAMQIRVNSTSRSIVVTARRADRPDFVDTVVVRDGDVVSVSPMQDADQLPLDDVTFPVASVPVDDLERLADDALEAFGEADGFVEAISITLTAGAPEIRVDVESSRRTGSVLFDAEGGLIGVER